MRHTRPHCVAPDSIFKELNQHQTHLRIPAARIAPEVCISFTLQNRGRRESRMPIAPAVVRTKSARVDHRFNRITPAFPARWCYGLLRTLPGDRALLPPSSCGLTIHLKPGWADASPQDLTPASGRQDHTTSPSAPISAKGLAGPRAFRRFPAKAVSSVVRPRAGRSLTATPALRSHCAPDAVASIAALPAFVTIMIRPSVGWDGNRYSFDLGAKSTMPTAAHWHDGQIHRAVRYTSKAVIRGAGDGAAAYWILRFRGG